MGDAPSRAQEHEGHGPRVAGPLCPFGDGRHKLKPWQGENNRSGFACAQCSKTWEWRDGELQPTWEDR